MAKFGRVCKEYMIKELTAKIKGSPNMFVADFINMSASDLEKLRQKLRLCKASYIVVKNSLCKLALKNAGAEPLTPFVEGSIGLVLGGTDPIAISKALLSVSKDLNKLHVKGAVLDGKLVQPSQIKEISLLPPREVLLARAFGGMKAPVTGFVNVLHGTLSKFAYAINEIKNKREGGAS
ncbi:MAG: 50S ribosomal protein L10 [Candidatus Omnitrophica bacterium]|nr:50S ribosomal protein L10 [Candidatus Omnitrophota bacterium]